MNLNLRLGTVSVRGGPELAGLLLVVSLAGCGGDSEPSAAAPVRSASPPAGATASTTLLSIPEWDAQDEGAHVPIEPGTYLIPSSDWSVASFTVTFPEGWTVQYGHVYAKHSDQPDEFGFYGVVVEEIFADTCRGEGGPTRAVGPGVDALVTALREQKGGALTTNVTETTFGGYPATRLDLRIPERLDLSRCQMAEYGFTGLQVWYSEPTDKYFVLLPGGAATVYVVDVEGERQVFLTQVGNPDSEADLAELETVLDSIDIEGQTAPG
ncbi:hypothetical protein [Nocardioides dilutus]